MRLVVFTIAVLFLLKTGSAQEVFHGCGMAGDTKVVRLQALNRIKNRYVPPTPRELDPAVSIESLLRPGNDVRRWSMQRAARITAFVVDVKPGGDESCNCKADAPEMKDTHIEVVLNPQVASKSQHLVVEVSPRIRTAMAAKNVDWSTTTLRKLALHQWITVTGWLFLDQEHTNAADNTHPGGKHNWRATAWEIHPVTDLRFAAPPTKR